MAQTFLQYTSVEEQLFIISCLMLLQQITATHLLPEPDAATFSLTPAAYHDYSLTLEAGEPLLIAVEQQGVDVSLSLFDGSGQLLLAVDSPFDEWGPERLFHRAAEGGTYRLRVATRAERGPTGIYQLRRMTTAVNASAFLHWSQAGSAYFGNTAEQYRNAIEAYTKADASFTNQLDWQIRCRYSRAVLHRLLQENSAALSLIEQIMPLLETSENRLLQGYARIEQGLLLNLDSRYPEAASAFQHAEKSFAALDHPQGQATAINNLGLIDYANGDLLGAINRFETSLALNMRAGITRGVAETRLNQGFLYRRLGEPAKMLDCYQRAFEAFKAEGQSLGMAQVNTHFGLYYSFNGLYRQALIAYRAALTAYETLDHTRGQARALNNIGKIYNDLGDPERALHYLTKALALRRKGGDKTNEISTLLHIGNAHFLLQQPDKAQAIVEVAQAKAQALNSERSQAAALSMLALLAHDAADFKTSLAMAEQLLALPIADKDLLYRARGLLAKGRALVALDDLQTAQKLLSQALTLLQQVQSTRGQIETLAVLAACLRREADLVAAEDALRRAITLIETKRDHVEAAELRARYLAIQHKIYQELIDVLMVRHFATGDEQWMRQALSLNERVRARVLLEQLSETRADIHRGISASRKQQLTLAEARLHAKRKRQRQLQGKPAAQVAAADGELEAAWIALQELERTIETESPAYSALLRPKPLPSEAIQKLLEPQTAMVSFALGARASYAWLITHTQIKAFRLPPRQQLENEASAFREVMANRDLSPGAKQHQQAKAEVLGRSLFAPFIDQVNQQRLVIVADGALQAIPLAALVLPQQHTPLIDHFSELIVIPSASVLAQLRKQNNRRTAEHGIAILADPVFARTDPRISVTTALAPTRPGLELTRLPNTASEADAIVALLPAKARVSDKRGPAATRAWVLGNPLADYRYLHFATHGLIDNRRPELSSLALSFYTAQGTQIEGFLSLRDIYNLDLNAELVVLSGCETGLGTAIRGEGLLNLTRAFLYAGSDAVIASLWRVPDRATAALMAKLYGGILEQGLTPAAALASAQRQMRQHRRWRDPYYWAGFTMQGTWQTESQPSK